MSKDVYIPIRTLIDIGFDGEVRCKYCPLLETYSRNLCRRTGEYITDVNYTGRYCPLRLINDEQYLNYLHEGEQINETV